MEFIEFVDYGDKFDGLDEDKDEDWGSTSEKRDSQLC